MHTCHLRPAVPYVNQLLISFCTTLQFPEHTRPFPSCFTLCLECSATALHAPQSFWSFKDLLNWYFFREILRTLCHVSVPLFYTLTFCIFCVFAFLLAICHTWLSTLRGQDYFLMWAVCSLMARSSKLSINKDWFKWMNDASSTYFSSEKKCFK